MTPERINHLPVVAMVRLPDRDGLLRHRHVVVCRDDSMGEGHEYVVWRIAWQDGAGWVVTHSGRYDLPWDRALDLMIQKGREG